MTARPPDAPTFTEAELRAWAEYPHQGGVYALRARLAAELLAARKVIADGAVEIADAIERAKRAEAERDEAFAAGYLDEGRNWERSLDALRAERDAAIARLADVEREKRRIMPCPRCATAIVEGMACAYCLSQSLASERARCERLVEALEPFARAASVENEGAARWPDWKPCKIDFQHGYAHFTVGDLRRAAAVLAEVKGQRE